MIQISFTRGAALRRVFINGRIISLLGAELNNVPLKINLDLLEDNKEKLDKMNVDKEFLKELANLKTEEDMANDVTKDFEKDGWRVFRR